MESVVDRDSCAQRVAARLRRRLWPIAGTVALLTVGMAYSLFWAPVVRHHPYWLQSGDLWATYRDAHYVGWGYLGGIYSAGTALVTFPGILLALAPVAMLTGALGLTEGFPKFVAKPGAWLLLGPYTILLSATALFACDALAERLGVTRCRRALLCFFEVVALWNVAVIWGHPEDAVAVGLALYALLFALDRRWTGAGWLFGLAVATQPLVLLMLPVVVALAPRVRVAGLLARSVAPAAALLVTPLVSQFGPTSRALLDQPNYPVLDHATPWTALAPVLGGRGTNLTVSAGPGRTVALVLAVALGWWVRRMRDRPEVIVWAAALALALRCLTESVMVAFYVWPVLAVALVAASDLGRWRRLMAAGGCAAFTTVATQWHLGWLAWWSITTAGILVALLTATPSLRRILRTVPTGFAVETTHEPRAALVGVHP
jgi:hypothetical protein